MKLLKLKLRSPFAQTSVGSFRRSISWHKSQWSITWVRPRRFTSSFSSPWSCYSWCLALFLCPYTSCITTGNMARVVTPPWLLSCRWEIWEAALFLAASKISEFSIRFSFNALLVRSWAASWTWDFKQLTRLEISWFCARCSASLDLTSTCLQLMKNARLASLIKRLLKLGNGHSVKTAQILIIVRLTWKTLIWSYYLKSVGQMLIEVILKTKKNWQRSKSLKNTQRKS